MGWMTLNSLDEPSSSVCRRIRPKTRSVLGLPEYPKDCRGLWSHKVAWKELRGSGFPIWDTRWEMMTDSEARREEECVTRKRARDVDATRGKEGIVDGSTSRAKAKKHIQESDMHSSGFKPEGGYVNESLMNASQQTMNTDNAGGVAANPTDNKLMSYKNPYIADTLNGYF